MFIFKGLGSLPKASQSSPSSKALKFWIRTCDFYSETIFYTTIISKTESFDHHACTTCAFSVIIFSWDEAPQLQEDEPETGVNGLPDLPDSNGKLPSFPSASHTLHFGVQLSTSALNTALSKQN